ncbi:MAG: succinoglycan biosynthesis protein [Alphaproteobacteria bacterium]|nr:succinoglycan biosynthesis protein [Alphaproteobacteria bacterium]
MSEIVGVASVIDGDTLEIHNTRIRLHAIDAPESTQLCTRGGKQYRCGQHSALALDRYLEGTTVRCQGKTIDRYKRLVAVCYRKDEDINAWLVKNGLALAYRQYGTDYVTQEDTAKSSKSGVWGSDFEAPWDFRKKKRR